MKQKKIKQLALLGLASGLLAATSAQAAERATLKEGLNRASNARTQPQPGPVAGCGAGSCGAVADNFAPSGAGCNRPQNPGTFCNANASDPRANDPHANDPSAHPVRHGCAPMSYNVNDPNEKYDAARHGAPNLQQPPMEQPEGTFRYIGETSVPPQMPARNASAPRNSARFLNETNVPPTSSSLPPSSSYPSGSRPAPMGGSSPYSTQPPYMSNEPSDRMYRSEPPAPSAPALKSESTKNRFW